MPIRFLIRLLLVALSILGSMGQPVRAQGNAWRVGTAKVKITPEEPQWMAGYSSRVHPSDGALHDLWVKALALEAPDGGRSVVVTSDLLGFPRDVATRICSEIQSRCELDRARIMLTCSHSHCGPVLDGALPDIYPLDDAQRAIIKKYTAALEKKVVATAAEALAHLQPATLWAGQGHAFFGANRRNNRNVDMADLRAKGIAPVGPDDHDVPVLAVRSPQGEFRAAMLGYACHNTTLDIYRWCGDYAGFAQLALEQKHPGMTALFWIGCGADQNPLPRRTVELCQQYGQSLAATTADVLARPMRPIEPRLCTAFAVIRLAFQVQPTRERLEKLLKTKANSFESRWAKRLLDEQTQGKSFPEDYPYPIQVWKLGRDQVWIALGGEVVVDYAIRFKKAFGGNTWVTGYTNDVMSYIPSHRVWEEGGYEAGAFSVYGLPAERWTEDIESQISRCVARLVDEVSQRPSARR
jgi:hypothetical protein